MLIDNKKTREISWNDFELSGNKENLIKQGWESFEPYGSGKNYVKNWNFTDEDLVEFGGWGISREVLDNRLICTITMDAGFYSMNMSKKLPLGDYIIRYKARSSHGIAEISWENVEYEKLWRKPSEKFVVYEHILSVVDDTQNIILRFYPGDEFGRGTKGNTMEIDWIQITPIDDQHLVVEKTPLEKGLTRIQTWGGNADMKLKSPNFGQLGETGTDMTISLYVENNSDSMIRFSNNLAIGGEPYPDGAEYMITVPREYKGFAYLKGEKVDGTVELDIRSDGNIDMIVSQPEIIEGHDLNAMLLIEDLDDGRKHVQVHNVNENTKLVYTGGNFIKGEPYTLETEIENDGRIFNLSANVFDSVVEVQKGMNDIRKSGELQDKELKIEIGVD